MDVLRKARLHLEERNGRLRKAAKVLFTGRDASLYLIPYAARGQFFYGQRSMDAGQTADTFDFREQLRVSSNPKLSIHETGQVHIYANDRPKAGPVHIPHLTELRGEHIATVQWDAIAFVPEMQGKTRVTGAERDWAFGVPNGVQAGAILLYANGEQPAFMGAPIHIVFQVERRPEPPSSSDSWPFRSLRSARSTREAESPCSPASIRGSGTRRSPATSTFEVCRKLSGDRTYPGRFTQETRGSASRATAHRRSSAARPIGH
jgi:hypothetical protein